MIVNICTMWYNEEVLAPLFLKHYSWVDHIHIIVDQDTTDNTVNIINSFPNTSIEYFKFPDMFDDSIKIQLLNNAYKKQNCDWCLILDSDEFVFKDLHTASIKSILNDIPNTHNAICMSLYDIYQHASESIIDYNKSVMEQRRHGVLDRHPSYTKPNIVRGNQEIYWSVGHHALHGSYSVFYDKVIDGTHWKSCNTEFAISRAIDCRKKRLSQNNIRNGWCVEYFDITADTVRQLCDSHKYDPQIF